MQRPSVLLIEEGELEDVSVLLEGLGVDTVRMTPTESLEPWPRPTRLLVASARLALSLGSSSAGERGEFTTIAITNGDSRTLRSLLRRMGFDYLVRRPIHPVALRLLLMRVLYRAPERRGETRFPVGYEVTWRGAWRRRRATLAEISPHGCRLLTAKYLGPGSRVAVRIPRALAGGFGLTLHGRVVRSDRARSPRVSRPVALGVVFDEPAPRVGERLDALLAELTIGPPTLPGGGAPPPPVSEFAGFPAGSSSEQPAGVSADRAEPEPEAPLDRRESPRGTFAQAVVTLDEQADSVKNVLVGCDLSVRGIRVEPNVSLAVGDQLRLALYDPSCREPFTVTARVARDDGGLGLALHFVDVESALARQIEEIVAALPAIEALRPTGSGPESVMMTEILPGREACGSGPGAGSQ